MPWIASALSNNARSAEVRRRNLPIISSELFNRRSTDDGAKEDLSSGRMTEEGADEIAMPIEAGRRSDNRHDAVGTSQLEQLLDLGIGQPGDGASQLTLGLELVPEFGAPFALVR